MFIWTAMPTFSLKMKLKDLQLRLESLRAIIFLVGDSPRKKKEPEFGKRPSWMVPATHGYHAVDHHLLHRSLIGGYEDYSEGLHEIESDMVVAQREQIGELELWYFGVFDPRIGDGIHKYILSHLFDKKKPIESHHHLKKKSIETMRKAYMGEKEKAKMREGAKKGDREKQKVGLASALVINGEKMVMAHMGDYRAVVCRDGVAHQLTRNVSGTTRHWSRKYIPGILRMRKIRIPRLIRPPKIRILYRKYSSSKRSELVIGDERVESDTEFVILASTGIWEVMKHQEAVNLIWHMEDPQEAAERLAREAVMRMSRGGNISCLVIRFDPYYIIHL